MKTTLTTLILLCSLSVLSQSWHTSTIKNAFDGEYKRASVAGRGNNYPYNSPYLVIHNQEEEPSIYISDLGYTGCGGNVLWFAFDGKVLFSTQDVTESLESDALFINSIKRGAEGWKAYVDSPKVSNFYLFERMIRASNMSVRWSGDCSSNDITFSLTNSSRSIQSVIGNIDAFMAKEEIKKKRLRESKRFQDSINEFTKQKLIAEEKKKDSLERQRIAYEEKEYFARERVKTVWVDNMYTEFINNTSARKLKSPIKLDYAAEKRVKEILSQNYDRIIACNSCRVRLRYNKGWKCYDLVSYHPYIDASEPLFLSLKVNARTKLLEIY